MANERIICCCGASTWSTVIACFQIVCSVILIVVYSFGLAGLVAVDLDQTDADMTYGSSIIAAVAMSLVMSGLGLIMGIILLKGTKQKRVGLLRAWLIYGLASILTSIVSLIINAINIGDSIRYTIGTVVIGIAIDAFCIAVVYIHMKEINEGVFMA